MTDQITPQTPDPGANVRWVVALVLLIGLVATSVLAAVLAQEESRRLDAQLDTRLREAAERVNSSTRRVFDAGFTIRALMGASPETTREDFSRLVELGGLLEAFPRVGALSFARWVPAGTDGRATDGVIVEYIEPLGPNQAAIGFDLLSEPTRAAAVTRARDDGVLAATAPLQLVQDTDGRTSILFIVPVYRDGQRHSTPPERRRAFLGVASMAIHTDVLLSTARPTGSLVDLEVFDVGTLDEDDPNGPMLLSVLGDPRQDALRRNVDINVGDRRWRLMGSATAEFGAGPRAWQVTLASGLVLTLALTALVNVQRNARSHAEALAQERTVALREANEQLLAGDRAKSAFLGTVSHELRTPLTAISGFIRMLQMPELELTDETRVDLLRRMDRNARSLTMLIEEVLTFSRLEAGPEALATEPTQMAGLVAATLETLEPLLQGAVVETDLAPDITADVDPDAMHRVLANLILNAHKYGGPGVAIRIKLRRAEDRAELVISDDGPGITVDEQAHVFDRFVRGSNTVGIPGTGIGLAVVKELTVRMGGEVSLASAVGQGTTVTVMVPLCATTEQGVRSATYPAP